MKHRSHRGISAGTIIMLALTVVVLGGFGMVLPRLMGDADIHLDARMVLEALNLQDAVPSLTLSDIPITDATEVPAQSPTPVPEAVVQATPVPTPVPTPTATPVPGGRVTLTFGGSIIIDDSIRKSAYYSDSKKYDFTEILTLIHDEMQSDVAFMPVENVTDGSIKVSALNAPEAVWDMLSAAGVDVAALGFAKAYDKGAASLKATITAAQSRGLTTVGAYADQADADRLRIITINNVDVAILHYTETLSATGKKAIRNDGAAYVLPVASTASDPDLILADVARAREAGADVVVVSINWSGTSSFKITAKMKAFMQQLADAGVDVIVGSGTKSVQEITWLDGKRPDGTLRQTLCAWSLGSLVNGERNDGNVAGLLLQLQLYVSGSTVTFERVSYTPTYIWRYKQDGQYQYRVVASDQPAPDGMSADHVGYMAKALKNIQKVLDASPANLRVKE